jgi:acyl dehydratase
MSTCGAMSGALATIFSLEKSRKWIIREGLTGISRSGSGAPIASGLKKSLGLRMPRLNLPVTRIPRSMGETETRAFETTQAAREASGARPYGRYLEDFDVGAVYKHWPAKTVTEADDHLFCLLTMNHHPLHINDVYAAESQQGRNVVVGPLVYSLALGMSVADISGKAIANLATEELSHPAPVFHGDTLFAESEVLEVRPSQSKTDRGVVKVHTRVHKQDGTLVAEFKRAVLVPRRAG